MRNQHNQIGVFYFLSFYIVFFHISSFGQNINPENNDIFYNNSLSKIELTLSESDKNNLLHPVQVFLDQYYPAKFHFYNEKIDTVLQSVGIRIRGNTSRYSKKKSFKIDFKEYGGEQFFKLKKFNLKPNNNDPSQLRETLSWQMYRNMNVAAARTNYIQLYINGEYMGVYLNVENIDDEFVDRRFGNEAGNLYKCTWGSTLDIGLSVYDNSRYEIKTNEEINNRSKLQALVNLLANTQDELWPDKLEQLFNVDHYLRQLAVESIIGHWDGYSFNTNNFYLYEDPETNRIQYIPYDLDNTWGIDWIGHDWGTEDLTSWYTLSYKVPLTRQILNISKYYNRYIAYLNDAMEWFNTDYVKPLVQVYQQQLHDAIQTDDYYPLDYGYTLSNFLNAFDVAAGGHVDYGIGKYIETRLSYATQQLPALDADRMNANMRLSIFPNPSDGQFIQILGAEIDQIQIFDIHGQGICFNKNNHFLYFQKRLQPGIYILKTKSGTKQFVVSN